jgi:hypothetical protein
MLKTLILPIWLIFHPVHVTLTSIDNVPGSDSIKVFVKMYFDDFLRDYKLFDIDVNMDSLEGDKPFPASLMGKYLNEKVIIMVNNKELNGKLLNMTLADNEISMNLVYKSVRKPQIIMVRNTIMTGLYTDQANMTIIRINDFEQGVKLTPEESEQTFTLN